MNIAVAFLALLRQRTEVWQWEYFSEYTFNGRAVSADEFDRLLSELLGGYEMVPNEITSFGPWYAVWDWDWNNVSENDLRGFLASFVPER